MKRQVRWLGLAAMVCCCGQTCNLTPSTGNTGGGELNICQRAYFNKTWRVGFNPPGGARGPSVKTPFDGAELYVTWNWSDPNPAIDFTLVVLKATAETTLEAFKQTWLSGFVESGQYTLLNQSFITLNDGAQAWYLAMAPTSQPGFMNEFVFTMSQGRVMYVNTLYAPERVTDAEVDTIGNALISLCVDVN